MTTLIRKNNQMSRKFPIEGIIPRNPIKPKTQNKQPAYED